METARLAAITNSSGKGAAIAFATQTYSVYRTSLFQSRKHGYTKPHFASIPEYRKKFVMSCLSFRKFLRENKIVEVRVG